MQISELAQRTGVSVHALRHYEKLGMLQPARRASGYREYTEAMQARVAEIDAQIGELKTQRRAVVAHIAWMHKQQREHQAKKAQRLAATHNGKAPWPAALSKPRRKTRP